MSNIEIKGRIYDKNTYKVPKDTKISIGKYSTILNKLGFFSLKVNQDKIDINNPFLKIIAPGFSPAFKSIITENKEIKTNLGAIGLINPKQRAQETANELKNKVTQNINKAFNLTLNPYEKVLVAQRKLVNSQISKVQNTLFPLVAQILINLGLDNNGNSLETKCANDNILNNSISLRNKLSSQINQIFTLIISNASLAYIFQQLSLLFKQVELSVSNIPLPLSVPPGVGVPYSLVSQIQGIEDLLKNLESQSKESYKTLMISLLFLLAALILIVLLLSKIDKRIEECKETNFLISDKETQPINLELQEISKAQSSSQKPKKDYSKNINGFQLEIIKLNKDLPKKQAIAKNSQGLVVIKGESSYSAGEEVLIDELEFYIKSNNLKAY